MQFIMHVFWSVSLVLKLGFVVAVAGFARAVGTG